MPNCLFLKTGRRYKRITLFITLSFFPLIFFGQTLTGLWTGVLTNDSNTVRKNQSFEIALTEYRGKVYGYSRSEFIVDNVLYYVVKRVKGSIDGNKCEVKDDEIISYNFPTKLDKGVKVTSTFYRNGTDSAWYLDGTWQTNKTKNFYSIGGHVDLKEEKDLSASKIFPHLEELKLADDVSFYKDRKQELEKPPLKIVESDNKRTAALIAAARPPASKNLVKDPDLSKPVDIQVKKNDLALVKNTAQEEKTRKQPASNDKINPPAQTKDLIKEDKIKTVINKVDENNLIVKTNAPQADTLKRVKQTIPVIAKPDDVAVIEKPFAEKVAGRKSEYTQSVSFLSDSLELDLYDNGEVDGDTVTVYKDNAILMSHQGLKASAIKKMIYLVPGKDDEFTLVLFADNLGKYPPNTGLLIVHDGEETYSIRFSADLEKNAGVIFKRRNK